jgi:hypothetical protein
VHQYHPGAATFAECDALLTSHGFRMYDIFDLRYDQKRTDMDPVYQVPTLVQYDVLWAKEDSVVFRGAGFPMRPASKSTAMNEEETPFTSTSTNDEMPSREVAITKYPGGMTATPLTSLPLSTTEIESFSTPPSRSSPVWRRKKKTTAAKT